MSGRVVHFEIPYDDADRARAFYRDIFGWQITEMPEMDYNMVQTGPTNEQGFPTDVGYVGGGMLKRAAPAERPVVTIDVDDIDATLQKVESQGGSTVQGKQQVGEMGWAAYFKDAEANVLGLWESRR